MPKSVELHRDETVSTQHYDVIHMVTPPCALGACTGSQQGLSVECNLITCQATTTCVVLSVFGPFIFTILAFLVFFFLFLLTR